ncbi:hypothetical protein SAMN02745121_07285 [Nannocystis exedens]|uniref:Uncharacterized protein n=1 Tax=Nannocystis exedens TaxID=54 RepID=A0A1I2GH12_9BACT|nr:hypothetical protein NAEX_02966 [Nannocystis exedens]SFF16493.1 hypothetical protein SAMN02745121_07285 [Nannocystis exedens]
MRARVCPPPAIGAIVRAAVPRALRPHDPGPSVSARRAGLVGLLSLGTCLFGLACAPDLPVSQRIADPRILALRSDVIAPLFPGDEPADAGVRCEALPFETVRVTPFMVEPTGVLDIAGPDFDPMWIACGLGPAQGLFACLRGALPLDLDELEECPVPSFTDIDPSAMELPEYPSPCRLPDDGSDDGRLDFVAPFAANLLLGGDIELTMISQAPGSPSTRECAEAMLSKAADLPNDCIYAVTRVSVGPIEKLLSFAGMFGFELPPELGEVPAPEDIPDGDRNPRIASFRVTILDPEADEQIELGEQPRGAVVKVKRGQTVQIDTETPASDLQTYPVPINNGIGGMGSEIQTERIDGSWYRTWGTLLSGGSDDREAFNQWTMRKGEQDAEELPPDGRATLFYVLRDSRLGVDWWWLEVEVEP